MTKQADLPKLTIRLHPKTLENLKVFAARQRTSIQVIVETLIAELLAERRKKSS